MIAITILLMFFSFVGGWSLYYFDYKGKLKEGLEPYLDDSDSVAWRLKDKVK